MQGINQRIHRAAIVVLLMLTSGCANFLAWQDDNNQEVFAGHGRDIATDVVSCHNRLGTMPENAGAELDAASIGFMNWNIKKGELANWQRDIRELGRGKDLVLIQEAVFRPDFKEAVEGLGHWSFSPGYRSSTQLTGVMTLSRSEPLVQCNLNTREPWLGTPKATSITEYGLTGTDETLVVVNVHGVNFTLGVTEFQAQIDQVRQILGDHQGPVILAGDFNTWRKKRLNILNALARDLNLEPLSFKEDHRTTVFGFRLDHSYVRGLNVDSTDTRAVESSDHNPMSALLEF
ncbi:MAG: endonuclease/exonuclease/phosphatase family protein [Gammaproteobacteria bacterium]|nr:MAG: endonuclease/exonuclease/phosphatase family protein [Gammaproteobacteria bacterium]RLA52058.1 MAG: endonuclease/exonuclease/phosphatase family protein [Gammaproteobacteria bacterium]